MGVADVAGWLALATTCVAAIMTASNLGARVTGWGFVVFTAGAAAWITVGVATGQRQLLYSNVFLSLVDLFGIWRWVGRRARIADTAAREKALSARSPGGGEKLFATASLDGLPVLTREGEVAATAVDALAACAGGRINFLLIRAGGVGGIGETLHRLPWADVTVGDGEVRTRLSASALRRLPVAAA